MNEQFNIYIYIVCTNRGKRNAINHPAVMGICLSYNRRFMALDEFHSSGYLHNSYVIYNTYLQYNIYI